MPCVDSRLDTFSPTNVGNRTPTADVFFVCCIYHSTSTSSHVVRLEYSINQRYSSIEDTMYILRACVHWCTSYRMHPALYLAPRIPDVPTNDSTYFEYVSTRYLLHGRYYHNTHGKKIERSNAWLVMDDTQRSTFVFFSDDERLLCCFVFFFLHPPADGGKTKLNPFTTGNPFLGKKILGFSIWRGSGALTGLSSPHFDVLRYTSCVNFTQLYPQSSASWRILQFPWQRQRELPLSAVTVTTPAVQAAVVYGCVSTVTVSDLPPGYGFTPPHHHHHHFGLEA